MWRFCDLHNHTLPNESCSDDTNPEFVLSTGMDELIVDEALDTLHQALGSL